MTPLPNTRVADLSWRRRLLGGLLIIAVAWLSYANALSAPFVFDDFAAIVENDTIRHLGTAFSPPANTGVSGRPLVNLSLALNYAIGGLDPRGYHALNLALHAATGILLCEFLRRTLAAPRPLGPGAHVLALAAALLWVAHPLLTESVTCIVQRNEVLVALLYVLTLLAFAHGWQIVAIAACALGMATKEVMVSAPLAVLLYDRVFVCGSIPVALRKRTLFYAALASTWLLLGWLMLRSDARGGTVGFGLGVSAWHYFLTQCDALVLYLKLAAWPHPLVLDYGNPVIRDPWAVLPQALLLMGLAGFAFRLVWRNRPAGFAALLCFALLAPSSSVVPLTTQTLAEHRMYLPLASLITLAVVLLHAVLGKRRLAAITLATGLAFALIARGRNADYASELAIWSDTVAQRPDNARAHNNLALALAHGGRRDAALPHYRAALALDPDYAPAHANFADALVAAGEISEALPHYERALALAPDQPLVHARFGSALLKLGRAAEAVAHYQAALQLRPNYVEAQNNLGTAFLALGRWTDARAAFAAALRMDPGYVRARENLRRLDELQPRPTPR